MTMTNQEWISFQQSWCVEPEVQCNMEQGSILRTIGERGFELEELLALYFGISLDGLTVKIGTKNQDDLISITPLPASECSCGPSSTDQTSTIDGDLDEFLEDIIELKYFCGKLSEDMDEIHSLTRSLSQGTVFKYFWIFDDLQQKLESA